MSRYITEFMPEIAKATKRLIRDEVFPTMDSITSTSQFDIDYCIDALEREDDTIYEKDLKLLVELKEEHNVGFLEF